MIQVTPHMRILVAVEPADFRCGIDGLAALCQHQLHHDPRSGTLYVFINRRATMIRVLVYEQNGYWLMTKRLSKGRYRGWPRSTQPLNALQAVALRRLLSGTLE